MNIKKTELIIFHPKNYCVKFKLSGKRPNSISTAKYLGIFLDEHLLWMTQVNWVNSKLNQTTGTLSKPWDSLFRSYLLYDARFWGQENCANRNNIQKLQNQAIRKITFKKLHDPVNLFYEDLKILKFKDLHLQNCLFLSQIEVNQTIGKSFATLKHCGDNYNCQTRASTKKILHTPLYKANTWVFVLIQQNIIVLRIETSLKESSLTSQKLTILIENLNH